MSTFEDFLRWYNNKDVVPTLKTMQKIVGFFHSLSRVLKLGYTLPNLAINCLHKPTSPKFYPFTETDKDLLQKIPEDMVGGPSNVFTRKAVVDDTFTRDLGINCKSIVGIDAKCCILILCASPCQQDYTRDVNMTQNLKDLNLNRTNPEIWRKRLWHVSKDKVLSVKLRVSTQQELRKRLIVSR